MGNYTPPPREVCECCEWQYSRRQYSNIGEVCNPCEKYYSSQEKGKVEKEHDEDDPLKKLDPHPWDSQYCNCCELEYNGKDVMTVKFECRKENHYLQFCINCGAKQAGNDSLKCPFLVPTRSNRKCDTQPRQADLNAIAEKRKRVKVAPIGM